jgi:uncharacterized protein
VQSVLTSKICIFRRKAKELSNIFPKINKMNQMDLETGVINECRRLVINKFRELNVKPVYIAVSGSHLYGFPSIDSDVDIRCSHIADTKSFFHLSRPSEIIQWKDNYEGMEIEFESQEIQKTIGLAMGNNSNILEHIFSKNLLTSQPTEYLRLKELTIQSMSKLVYNPYHGLAEFNYKKFIESMNPTYRDKLVKKYLYVIRAYLVGTYALERGEIEPNIRFHLKKDWNYDSKEDRILINELIEKKEDAEYQVTAINHKRCRELIARLKGRMELAKISSLLPDNPTNQAAWDDFIYNVRLRNL